MKDDGDKGRKPYERTYRGGGRRRALDDELAGLRPARERPAEEPPPRDRRSTSGDRRRTADERHRSTDERRSGADRRRTAGAEGRPGERFDWGEPRDREAGAGAPAYRRYHADGADGDAGDAAAGGRAAGGAARSAAGPAHRRRFRWWHIPLALLTLVVLAVVVLTVIWYPDFKRFDRAVAKSNDRIDAKTREALSPDEGTLLWSPTTVLVLGTDSKAGEPARSDTIMLMRFDPDTHSVNQLSIPRDTKVDVPGRGTMKLNEAMFWGGTSLAVKTVQDYVGIPINHVMVVNFKGFPRIVNAVGGIDMYVSETVSTVAGANRRTVTFEKGWQHFDGKYAMLYVRIRYADNDFKRASRQQRFVRALQKKVAQPSNITKLPDLGRRFMSGIDTDLTTSQLLALAWVKWRSDDEKSKHWVLAGEPAYIGGTAYVLPPSDAKKARVIGKFLGE